jgi:hypothetical protein
MRLKNESCVHQDVPLCPDVRHLLLGHHVRLPQDLHGVHVAGVDLLDQSHLRQMLRLFTYFRRKKRRKNWHL